MAQNGFLKFINFHSVASSVFSSRSFLKGLILELFMHQDIVRVVSEHTGFKPSDASLLATTSSHRVYVLSFADGSDIIAKVEIADSKRF